MWVFCESQQGKKARPSGPPGGASLLVNRNDVRPRYAGPKDDASPLAMLAGPEMLPVSAGLAAFAGSGKKKKVGVSKKQGRKIKKGVDLAAQIGPIIAESQGYQKEAGAMQRAGKVVANRGGGKKTKKS